MSALVQTPTQVPVVSFGNDFGGPVPRGGGSPPVVPNWRSNPNYILSIYNNNQSVDPINRLVQAYLPENFHFRVQNQWEPFLNLGDMAVGEYGRRVGGFFGTAVNLKMLSALIWRHSEPINFSFLLMFDARTSAFKDVTLPIARLIMMAAPTRGDPGVAPTVNGAPANNGSFSPFLWAPGPTLSNPTSSRINMKVGRFFYIDSIVFDSMDITWYTAAEAAAKYQGGPAGGADVPGTGGDFIAADVELSLSGWYTPDKDDILSYFGLNPQTQDVRNFIKSAPLTDAGFSGPLIFDPDVGAFTSNVGSYIKGLGEKSGEFLQGIFPG